MYSDQSFDSFRLEKGDFQVGLVLAREEPIIKTLELRTVCGEFLRQVRVPIDKAAVDASLRF